MGRCNRGEKASSSTRDSTRDSTRVTMVTFLVLEQDNNGRKYAISRAMAFPVDHWSFDL